MRYQKPHFWAATTADALILGSSGSNKAEHTCNDGGQYNSTGAYEVDE